MLVDPVWNELSGMMTRLGRLLLTPLLVLSVGGCPASGGAPAAASGRTNIVFVLTDDLSMNLVPYMPHVQALQKAGVTFTNYTVTDSLCCPSRSSIFSGKYPHDTGVFTNGGNDGGFGVFHKRGEENATFATDLQRAGYRTAMMGKYLNGYLPRNTEGGSQPYVPPGWTEWDVAGNGYPEFDYNLNENHKVQHYGKNPDDYLTDVISAKASTFITGSATAGKPFLIELATFAPHAPYTPAPQDADKFPDLKAPRGPAFDKLPTNAPSWLARRVPLTGKEITAIDTAFRKRVQAVQSVDRMIGSLRATLTKAGVAERTVVVFSSDNGYHMGEYRLNPGKQTAFDTDIHVPLIAAGPGLTAGKIVAGPAQNIDLRPTFDTLAGVTPAADIDGHTLAPLMAGTVPDSWRIASLIEHHGPDTDPSDPDKPAPNSGNPPTYAAMRTATSTYVEYRDATVEFYDRRSDPNELHNTASTLSASDKATWHKALVGLVGCHGSTACWTAGRP
jgi:N-acetylglucosamine-6-sulfatase